MTFALLGLAGGLALLLAGGESVVRGALAISLRLGITPLVAGLTIVAFGTSSPELVVSLQAALQGEGGLAIGNVVGSNICNVGLILGIAALIRPMAVDSTLVRRELPIMIAVTLVLLALLLDGHLSRTDGVLLAAGMAGYILYTLWASQSEGKDVEKEFEQALPDGTLSTPASLLITALGLAALVYGGRLFVSGAVQIAHALDIAPALVGLSVAAVGTSLPELATSAIAAYRGHGDMAAGNVVGSNIFNALFVLGVSAIASPLQIGAVSRIDLAVMLAASLLAMRLMKTGLVMERWEGFALLAAYAAYMGWLFI